MAKYIIFFISCLPFALCSQCECPALPSINAQTTTVEVANVQELGLALDQAKANGGYYEILLASGVYQLTSNLRFIDQQMPHLTIRSKSENAEDVIIRGHGMTGNISHIFNVAASHFTIADVTIGWVANHGIQIRGESNADHALIHNVRFFDIREQMIKGSGGTGNSFSDSCIVECCHFEFTSGVAHQYYTGGIDVHKGNSWIVRHNTFVDIRSPDQTLAEHAIHFWSGSRGTVVDGNWIINCDRGIGFGLGNRGHTGGIILNNMVHTSRDVGIGLETSPNTKVYNNTVITDNYFNSIEYRFNETENVHIANNLVNKNIASRNGGTGKRNNNLTITDLNIFIDASNHDYHLKSWFLPSILGEGQVLVEVDHDFDCDTFSRLSFPDIGADQIELILSTKAAKRGSSSLYPNPTHNTITIDSELLEKYEVYNTHGNLILYGHSNTIDLNTVGNGYYNIIIINSNGTVELHKCIKK